MIPTPDLSHLTSADYLHVYEPAEDTFLLLDALEVDQQSLKDLQPRISLEIGSGSGCVTCFIASILGPSVLYLCTDINPHACLCTHSTGAQNQVSIQCINASLASPLRARLKHSVDVIIFNPPYVPTLTEEVQDAQRAHGIDGAWAGGPHGMNITDLFLDHAAGLMSPNAMFYLVAIRGNNIPSIRDRMQRLYSLKSDVILDRRAGREHLFVLRFVRDDPT